MNPRPLRQFTADALQVAVFATAAEAGQAAATEVVRVLEGVQREGRTARVVFAAAPSQDAFLAHLTALATIDWSRVTAFHMDEYLGLSPDHRASFRRYLAEHLFEPIGLPPESLRLIPAERTDQPLAVCLAYENALRAEPPDLVCGGIGENGHLAFNDPPVADFLDPVLVKIVRLDVACRTQQVNDGCFARVEDVPTHAFTMTIPALMAAPHVSIVVPGPRKATAAREALQGPISEACPASILRTHSGARLCLDVESARLIDEGR